MNADDPRHGSYAGHLAHRRANEQPCDPCRIAARRTTKGHQYRLSQGIRRRVPLGEEAWRVITQCQPGEFARVSGLSRRTIGNLRAKTPDSIILASTKEIVLRSGLRCPTPVGIQRRLQALSYMGWSMATVAGHAEVGVEGLKRLRVRSDITFLKPHVYKGVLRAYERLSMARPPTSRATTATRNSARKAGYLSPLSWDDDTIDDPGAKPVGLTGRYIVGDYIDEAAVVRRMAGERLTLTKAERIEVVTRLRRAGWTYSGIEEHTGLKTDRYIAREKAAA